MGGSLYRELCGVSRDYTVMSGGRLATPPAARRVAP